MPPPPAPGPTVSALLVIVVPGDNGDQFFRSVSNGIVDATTHLELATAWNPFVETEYHDAMTALRALGIAAWTCVLGLDPTTAARENRYVSAARLI